MAIGEWREHVGGGNTFLFIVQNEKMIFEINEHCTCYNVQHFICTHISSSHTHSTHILMGITVAMGTCIPRDGCIMRSLGRLEFY